MIQSDEGNDPRIRAELRVLASTVVGRATSPYSSMSGFRRGHRRIGDVKGA
jgi:hypothetical protein